MSAPALRLPTGFAVLLALGAVQAWAEPPAGEPEAPQVVLLHGLARNASSMRPMARALERAGYAVCNIDYPSRRHGIAELAARHVAPALERCPFDDRLPVHFVTHSMGGIVLRQLVATGRVAKLGRVVMLAPPNGGSAIVDRLGAWRLFGLLNGPAGRELGTARHLPPATLGPALFELGVIAGTRSVNPLLSMLIPGDDDGKVALSHTRLDGMQDHLEVDVAHPLIMRSVRVQQQTLSFLATGAFFCSQRR